MGAVSTTWGRQKAPVHQGCNNASSFDFSICRILDKMFGEMREEKAISTEAELRTEVPRKLIDDAIEHLKKRIDMLIENEEGHIEVHMTKK